MYYNISGLAHPKKSPLLCKYSIIILRLCWCDVVVVKMCETPNCLTRKFRIIVIKHSCPVGSPKVSKKEHGYNCGECGWGAERSFVMVV